MPNKIVDCFLFYDEFEMLNFRLSELNNYVDYFIIIETDRDLLGSNKTSFYDENKSKFELYSNKIIPIYCKIPENFIGKDVINKSLIELETKLKSLDLNFEDIIMFSHVDEIPDFNKLKNIEEMVVSSTFRLKQKEFVWNHNFFNHDSHFGTIVTDFSKLISSKKNIFISSLDTITNFNYLDCGWHFSQFYPIEKIKNKLKLLSTITKKEFLNVEYLRDNLVSISNQSIRLTTFEEALPVNTHLLPYNDTGRKIPKITVINVENFKSQIFIPKVSYYNSINVQKYGFETIYFLNELKKKLLDYYPIDNDVFYFQEYSKEYRWIEIKNSFLSDLLLN